MEPPGVPLEIRPARPEHFEVAVDILEQAAGWLQVRGLDGWSPGMFRDPGGRGRRFLHEALEAGNLHLAWRGGRAVATVTVQWDDQLFWPDEPPVAGYVHRLAVANREHGHGLGGDLLAWAEGEAVAGGKAFLRLDCAADDSGIKRYYERAGFLHVRDLSVADIRVSLYQKPLPERGG